MAIQISGSTVIDNSRNYTNGVGANFSGTLTANAFSGDGNNLTNLPVNAGTVQVVHKYFGSSFGSGAVGNASITPTSSSNKILIYFNGHMYRHNGGNRGGSSYAYLQRGGVGIVTIQESFDQNGDNDSSNWRRIPGFAQRVDGPGTTGSVTYDVNFSGSAFEYPNVTLIEIDSSKVQ